MRYSRSDAGTITETCDYEGQIVSVNVKQDDTVENGMLLYVVDTGEGKAAITEAKMRSTQRINPMRTRSQITINR